MTTRAEYLALAERAERAERAEGADRELDGAIATALGWTEVHGSVMAPAFQGGRPPGVTDWWDHVPAFTASLDAALSLVPEGWRWSLDFTQRAPYQDCGCATLFAPGSGYHPPDVPEVYAATPALALVAAALRARAEEAKDG